MVSNLNKRLENEAEEKLGLLQFRKYDQQEKKLLFIKNILICHTVVRFQHQLTTLILIGRLKNQMQIPKKK